MSDALASVFCQEPFVGHLPIKGSVRLLGLPRVLEKAIGVRTEETPDNRHEE
jgi:hypothetical protein